MDTSLLPILLGLAVLLPLGSFWVILLAGNRLGKQAATVAVGAIVGAGVLSFWSLAIWLVHYYPTESGHGTEHHDGGLEHGHSDSDGHSPEPHALRSGHAPARAAADGVSGPDTLTADLTQLVSLATDDAHGVAGPSPAEPTDGESAPQEARGPPFAGDYYTLGLFGRMRLTIGYYIDTLTVLMFCMVTLIASCIHFYAIGYMHEELHDVTDHEVTLSSGRHLTRPGRFHRFFQYLSLFCFSMLGLVLAGNIAMVFVFWELVGICSYFLIGFYIERKSATNAANKAFIVNRVGDFGMIIGLMALWTGLGTFSFGSVDANSNGTIEADEQGMFELVRPGPDHHYRVPLGMALAESRKEVATLVQSWNAEAARSGKRLDKEELHQRLARHAEQAGWLEPQGDKAPRGYWWLIIGGVGIFCGCVGKSAQFPLHVWLPDAMEGPTPVSALVHSATMVAAGVYLVGRFYPMFTPEVLWVIAVVGCITLFMAATIAITATDIKRVLAYSTISQLGYMMLSLGVGGWAAGLMHLVTHAFFKSLLFMCSGSVIHAVHTNDMMEMGGLRKKMPYTAYTMLVGCLAIAGVSIPFVVGFSGYYSKDRILEQAFVFMQQNHSVWGALFFYAALGGAAITAFYMFRLWFLTFAGKPRNQHRYDHAHESPKVMYVPLIILAVFATGVAWKPFSWLPGSGLHLAALLEQARPAGVHGDLTGYWTRLVWPDEHFAHAPEQFYSVVVPVTLLATGTALSGISLAAVMYLWGWLSPGDVRRRFPRVYAFLWNKWYFDELYGFLFVRPTLGVARLVALFDRRWIDWVVDGCASLTRAFANAWEKIVDRGVVDGLANLFAGWVWSIGVWFHRLETGRLRQYVLYLIVGFLALFVLVSLFWSTTLAGGP